MGRRHAAGGVVLLTLAGGALRLWSVRGLGTSYDELDVCGYLGTADFWTYWQLFLPANPDNVPLFPLLLFGWGKLFSDDLETLRLLGVTLSTAGIPLLYLLGSACYGRGAGVVAAMLYAFSGRMVWHAGEPRFYVLMVPVALVSMLALVRASQTDRRRWWALNLMANLALMHTFLFSVFLIATQGLFLLLTERRRGVLAGWGLVAGISVVSAFAWILPAWSEIPTAEEDEYAVPGIAALWVDWTADELAQHVHDIDIHAPYDKAEQLIPFLHPVLASLFVGFEAVLFGVFVLSLIWLTVRVAPLLGRCLRSGALGGPDKTGVLVWLLILVPPLMIFVVSYLWRPCFMPRYTLYATCMHFVVAGALLCRIRGGLLRSAVVVVVGLAMVAQMEYITSGWTRQPWPPLSAAIDAEATRDDLVLSRHTQPFTAFDHLAYVRGGNPGAPTITVPSLQVALHHATAFLSSPDTPVASSVYFATRMNRDPALFAWFEAALEARGLRLEWMETFRGWETIELYRIAGRATRVVVPAAPVEAALPDLLRTLWREDPEGIALAEGKLGEWLEDGGRLDLLMCVLLQVGEVENAARLSNGILRALADLENSSLAGQVPPELLAQTRANTGLLAAQAAYVRGDRAASAAAIEGVLAADYGADAVFEDFFRALYLRGDGEEAVRALGRVDARQRLTPHALWVDLGLRRPVGGIPRAQYWLPKVPPMF